MNYFRCGGGRSTHTATKIDIAKTPLATFESNVSGLYIPEILAYITATQSGTGDPSPSNPRTINGVAQVDTTVCGVNLYNKNAKNTSNGYKNGYYLYTDGVETSNANYEISEYIIAKPNTEYTLQGLNGDRVFIGWYDSDKALVGTGRYSNNQIRTFTSPANTAYMRISVYIANEDILQCQIGDTATPYESYTGQTATINLGGTYYGGYLNVPTGLLTVTHGRELISNLGLQWDGDKFISNALQNVIETPVSSSLTVDFTAEALKYMSYYDFIAADNAIVVSTSGYIVIKASAYGSSVADLETAIGNTYIIYPLATPQTVQLTPAQLAQLLGQNNVFCSADDVAVKYWKID